MVKLLLSKYPDVEAREEITQSTALHLAAREGHAHVILYLMAQVSEESRWRWKGWEGCPSDQGIVLVAGRTFCTEAEKGQAWEGPLRGWGEWVQLGLRMGLGLGWGWGQGSSVTTEVSGRLPSRPGSVCLEPVVIERLVLLVVGRRKLALPVLETGVSPTLTYQGAETSARDKQQDTPLHKAAEMGHLTSVQALVDAGKASLKSRNAERETPLSMACAKVRWPSVSR